MAYGRGGLYIDPSFQMGLALGNAYGNMWASNAKKRQGEHAKDILEEMRQQQQIEEIANMNQPQAQQPQKAVSVTGNIPGYNGFDLKRGTILDPQFSLSSATPDGRSVQENAADELGMKRMGAYPITAEQQAAGEQLEKLGQYPLNVNASEQNAEVASNPQTVKQGQDGSANAPAAKLGFNPNFSADEFKRRANERGLNKEVIDMYLPDVQKEAAVQARNNLLPEIMDGLYGYTNEEGKYVAPSPESYRNANEKLMLLKQYDPDTANPLLSGSITPRDIYTENRADTVYGRTRQDLLTDKAEARSNKKQDAQESFALKRDEEKQQFLDQVQLFMEVYDVDYKTAAKLALGGSGTGRGKGGSGLPGSVSTQQMNAAKEEINAFDNWREMNPDVDVKTYPRYNQLNFAYQINDAALGYGGNGGSNTSFDWNDRNAVVAKAQEAIADGQSWESVLSIAKENMVDGETYRELERLAKQNEGTADNTASKQQNYADEYLANVEKEKLAQEQYNYGQLRNQAARAGLYVDTRGKVWPMNPSYFNPNSDDGKVKVELYNQWAAANGLPAWGQ